MPNTIDRIQKALSLIFFLDVIILIISFIVNRSFRVANYFGYGGMFIIGFLFLYTGYKRLSLLHKEDQRTMWYKQPWILVGLMTYVLAILLLITNR